MPGAARHVALSWLALAWERAWRAFWPAVALAGVALAVLLSGVLPLLPGWLHLVGLSVLGVCVLVAGVRAARHVRPPTRAEAIRRLEGAAGPAHRPLTAAGDRLELGAGDALSRALWARHQAQMAARARALRPGLPHPHVIARDPRALRLAPLPLLFAALVAAWPDPLGRLADAMVPRLGTLPPPAVAQVWVTPPAYTGQSPIYIESETRPDAVAGPEPAPASADGARAAVGTEPLVLPAGGTVMVVLRGGAGPGLLDLGGGRPLQALDDAGDGGQRLEVTVTAGTRLRLTQADIALIDRPLHVLPDLPPSVAWRAPPGDDGQGRLDLDYRADDDHGIETLVLEVRAAGGQVLGGPADLDLPVPSATESGRRAVRDLGRHPWAGTPVAVRLRATDGGGLTGTSETIEIILPARRFTHPVAQAVIDLRRVLVTRPERAGAVAGGLAALARDRESYDNRLAVMLGLSAAAARLALVPDGRAREEHLDLLWSIAAALEDGALTLAREDLQRSREALREALEEGAPQDEIERRLEAVREAFERLMRELAEAMPLATLPPMTAPMPMPEGMEMLDPRDIDRMLDEMAEMSELGAEEAARRMLDQLERMLEQLENARPPTPSEMQAMAEAADLMRRLQDIVRQQRALLDETFRIRPEDPSPDGLSPFREGPRPGETAREWLDRQFDQDRAGQSRPQAPDAAVEGLEERQRALRDVLERLMADLADRADQVPDQLGEADLAMREAERALRQGDTEGAARAQGRALDALTEGQGQAMGQMMGPGGMGGMGGMMGFGLMPGQPGRMGPGLGPGFGRDPFNRRTGPNGMVDDDSVEVPTEPDTRRAHEILRELRRRANEPDRTVPERDYLDRLMEPF
jgi:uncharacterized protein (TIGR02302 family)